MTKVATVILTTHNINPPNVYNRRTGITLTLLISSKIQFVKMKKVHNMQAVRNECIARGISFEITTNWKKIINMIKEHEGNPRYFTSLTNYYFF